MTKGLTARQANEFLVFDFVKCVVVIIVVVVDVRNSAIKRCSHERP